MTFSVYNHQSGNIKIDGDKGTQACYITILATISHLTGYFQIYFDTKQTLQNVALHLMWPNMFYIPHSEKNIEQPFDDECLWDVACNLHSNFDVWNVVGPYMCVITHGVHAFQRRPGVPGKERHSMGR